MLKKAIYLDNNATTPLDPKVLEDMMPYLQDDFGNASSRSHSFGWAAEDAVAKARQNIANLLQVEPQEIVFTSGATESINLAIKGLLYPDSSVNRLITVPTEHKAVIDVVDDLADQGIDVSYLGVQTDGLIAHDDLQLLKLDSSDLIEIMLVNNETGVIQDFGALSEIFNKSRAVGMCDATQAIGKMTVYPKQMGIKLMPFSGHKIYGPKGVGALFIDRELQKQLAPQILGGRHERGLRSGTLNVPGIVGLSKALQLSVESMAENHHYMELLRNRLESRLTKELAGVQINGSTTQRVCNTSNLSFEGVFSEDLLLRLGARVALSSGSACTSANVEPSHVLKAMGCSDDSAFSSIRFSVGRMNAMDEIDTAIGLVKDAVAELRQVSSIN